MDRLRPKRVLVAGGAGFLGSHLCRRLLERGDEVLCLDNFSTGRKDNLIEFMDNRRFELVRHDVAQPFYAEVDEIYNLACPASPPHYQSDPIQTLRTCFLGAHNLLGLAKRKGAKIFQASTSEVYGDPNEHPQAETYWGNVNPNGVRACYDEGKRCAETLFFEYWRVHRVGIKVARIFNTFGPQMDPADGRVVSNFIVQALTGQPLTIYGAGEQTRSFCYVDDLIEGCMRLMASPPEVIGPVNLGCPVEFTVLSLAERVLELTGSRSALAFQPLPIDDPRSRKPDITLAREVLAWQPATELETGLIKTIQYFEQLLSSEGRIPRGALRLGQRAA